MFNMDTCANGKHARPAAVAEQGAPLGLSLDSRQVRQGFGVGKHIGEILNSSLDCSAC